MPKYQYTGEGHTLIQTAKATKEKTKVVNGEIVEVEEGLFQEGRLMLAGFQKIVDGIEDIVDGATGIVDEITDAITGDKDEDIVGDPAPKPEPAETNETTNETSPEDTTPGETTENATSDESGAPADVSVETTNDGKDEITLEVETDKEMTRQEIIDALKAKGVQFNPTGKTTASLKELLDSQDAAF